MTGSWQSERHGAEIQVPDARSGDGWHGEEAIAPLTSALSDPFSHPLHAFLTSTIPCLKPAASAKRDWEAVIQFSSDWRGLIRNSLCERAL